MLQRLTAAVDGARPVTVEKVVALHTSRDQAIHDPLNAALERVARAPDVAELLAGHGTAWDRLWERARIQVPNAVGAVLRLHLFHVLQTLSPHTADLDVGVPARGLHGEAYRGHVFWDELFVLPFLNLHLPEVSRALLMYRHRRLDAACRAAAAAEGRRGAMYPWQSGSDGHEETQRLHLNPRSGRWLPDHTPSAAPRGLGRRVQRLAVPRGQRRHRLPARRGRRDAAAGRPLLGERRGVGPGPRALPHRGVVGPDEYHTAYPGADRPGLDDNAYTNVTAAWVLARALELPRRCRPRAARSCSSGWGSARTSRSAGRTSPGGCGCPSTPVW